MKKFAKALLRIIRTTTALALLAGAFFVCSGFSTRLPRGVVINGVDVGGLTRSCAARVLRGEIERGLSGKNLKVYAGNRAYGYAFPEIYYADAFDEELPKISAKGEYFVPVNYYLNGAESVVDYICRDCERQVVEPYATFNLDGAPFTYYEGADGIKANRQKLLEDISASVNGGWEDVHAQLSPVERTQNLSDIKGRTVKLYSFTTYFDSSNAERTANIRLAASKINGTVVNAGECFSFNAAVGARTEENGFRRAKIIEDGKFVLGVGGGVCQVSTTLYNAALLSGMDIAEYHPHSLAVSYVAPSRDAMVSGNYCDLKFVNNRKTPIYVRMKCIQGSICCTFYGESDDCKYSFISEVLETLPRPDDETVEGDEDKILSYGKEGLKSCGYLVKEKGGVQEITLLRKDSYSPVAGVRQVKRKDGGEEIEPEN